MKRILFPLLLLCMGCSNDNLPIEEEKALHRPPIPYNRLIVTESRQTDAPAVITTDTYTCQDGYLTDYKGEQTYTTYDYNLTYTAKAIYSENTVTISDSNNNRWEYQLDETGYAQSALYEGANGQRRHYLFAYTDTIGKRLLTNINETIENEMNSFSHIHIEYKKNNQLNIHQEINGFGLDFTAHTSKDDTITDTEALLTCPFLSELYPLSQHLFALRSGIIGDVYPLYIHQVIPTDNNKSQESVTYKYTLDNEGILNNCHIVTKSFGETFSRNISYYFSGT
ncbi:MAG: DUF4595 domain-containing protein [Mediterranea massiliensis]|nr:DUF4595 domain-containing protein [Mediterranea massiliensis]